MPTECLDEVHDLVIWTKEGEFLTLGDPVSVTINTPNEEASNEIRWLSNSVNFTVELSKNSVYGLKIAAGLKYDVPNNWLKKHHIPMNRRKYYGKYWG